METIKEFNLEKNKDEVWDSLEERYVSSDVVDFKEYYYGSDYEYERLGGY